MDAPSRADATDPSLGQTSPRFQRLPPDSGCPSSHRRQSPASIRAASRSLLVDLSSNCWCDAVSSESMMMVIVRLSRSEEESKKYNERTIFLWCRWVLVGGGGYLVARSKNLIASRVDRMSHCLVRFALRYAPSLFFISVDAHLYSVEVRLVFLSRCVSIILSRCVYLLCRGASIFSVEVRLFFLSRCVSIILSRCESLLCRGANIFSVEVRLSSLLRCVSIILSRCVYFFCRGASIFSVEVRLFILSRCVSIILPRCVSFCHRGACLCSTEVHLQYSAEVLIIVLPRCVSFCRRGAYLMRFFLLFTE